MDNMRFRYSITLHSLSYKSKLETVVIYISNNSTDFIHVRRVEDQTMCNPRVVGWDRGMRERVTKVLCVHFLFIYV